MIFNSYDFLFIFLPLVIFCYYLSPLKWRNTILMVSGYLFYGYWSIPFSSLLFLSTGWNFLLANRIYECSRSNLRKRYLVIGLVLNLGLLGFFKYTNFFIQSLLEVFPGLPLAPLGIILPIGISFFTFQGMSYIFDIYRQDTVPVRNFRDFACYIAMFPQLIAGPIVRFSQISAQLVVRQHGVDLIASGIRRFIMGLAKKVIVADSMAIIAQQQLSGANPGFSSVWIGMFSFSLQIYFDFAGYSDMAIGLGRLFGFKFPENFNYPYQARSMAGFWRRWHMTLSGWLKDYLYIPLGGSRCKKNRWVFNIFITFLLCGLWHGPAWTFVLWGGYHGMLIILERPFREKIVNFSPWLRIILVNFLVVFGWVLFKAESLGQAVSWYAAMFGLAGEQTSLSYTPILLLIFMPVVLFGCWSERVKVVLSLQPKVIMDIVLALLLIISVVIILGEQVSPFLYYQF